MDIQEARKQIIAVGKKLTASGAIGALEGNISCKVDDRILITPSGMSKEDLLPDQLSVMDLAGNWVDGPFKPSSESKMHIAIYRCRPDVSAVIHTHSPYATAFAIANQSIDLRCSAEFAIFFKHVPVLPYGTPGSEDIYRGIDEALEEYDTVLLQNHGVVSVGSSLMNAFGKCATLESVLKTYAINRQLFPDRNCDLPKSEIEKLWELGASKRGRKA